MDVDWSSINWPILLAAVAAGAGLGVFYFGGLWLTTQRVAAVRSPAAFVLGSFIGRTLLTLTGFYLVMNGRWEQMIACLCGFLLARVILVRRLGQAQGGGVQ